MAQIRRRDVIIAAIGGFIAWLWTVHFLPSLRFVPHAFALGVFITVGGVGYLVCTRTQDPLPDIAAPLPHSSFLGITSAQRWKQEGDELQKRDRYASPPIYEVSPPISKRLDELLDLTLRDFVKAWYRKISSGSAFANQIDRAIRASLKNILERALSMDLVEFGVTRLLPIINNHIKAYAEAERLVRGKRLNIDSANTQEVEDSFVQRYRDGKLHPAASLSTSKSAVQQQQHLRRLCSRVLPLVLPSNMQSSSSVITLVKEIVACAVLLPVMSLITDPDMINQLIENYGRSILHERKTIRKLRAALDQQAAQNTNATALPRLKREDSEKSFEQFVQAIRACSSVADAKRYQDDISKHVKRENTSQKRDMTYLRRLEIGRKLLGQRVQELSAQVNDAQPDLSKVSLRELLYDPSGLAYFMEYMDELHLVPLVQFWVVADAFRNNSTGAAPSLGQRSAAWVQSDRDLLVQISGRYLWKAELKVPPSGQEAVNGFLNAGDAATYQQYRLARLAILEQQDAVYSDMQDEHLTRFKSSDLFRRWSGAPTISSSVKPQINGATASTPDTIAPLKSSKSSSNGLKAPELRRAVASHSDLASAARKAPSEPEPRRSMDDYADRRPLFGDGFEENEVDDPLSRSIANVDSLDGSTPQPNGAIQHQMMNAAQAALDQAMDEESDEDFGGWGQDSMELPAESPTMSFDASRSTDQISAVDGSKPSLSSLGLVGTPSRRTVFSEGDMFGEGEKTLLEEDDGNETDGTDKAEDEDIHEAAPGDLGLSELVQTLTSEISKLEAQQKVVDSMTSKAELTNNPAELRILKKSKASLDREIRRKELQRQQYIVQRSENDLFGKATISIKSIMVGTEPDGHEFALYVIEVTRHGSEKAQPITWAITRRYSEFHDLHRRLRKRYPSTRDIDFPRRQVVLTLQKDFLKKRSAALERFLRDLLTRPNVCRSLEFRAFLSQQTIRPVGQAGNAQLDKQDFVTRIYSSVTDGMEEFIGNVPVLDQLSAAGQSLITAATSYNPPPGSNTSSINSPDSLLSVSSNGLPSVAHMDATSDRDGSEAAAEISAFESATSSVFPTTQSPSTNLTAHPPSTSPSTTSAQNPKPSPETRRTTFITPLITTLLDTFSLSTSPSTTGGNWLRGRTLVVVTQQLLGGTIERRVRDMYRAFASEANWCQYLDTAREMLWPGGVFRQKPVERTAEEKRVSRRNAEVVLETLLPELVGGVVGRGNAVGAGRRVLGCLNVGVLNRVLAYEVVDEIVDGVFGRDFGRGGVR